MPPKSLILSYVFDWIIIIALAAAAGGLNWVEPWKRPFSLLNLDISYPYIPEQISTVTLVLVSLVAPGIIIALIVGLFVPGPATSRAFSRSQVLQRKLWELEKGWAGLALSLATAFFVTQAAKNMFGKPRPDLLARCNPDLSDIASHVVGGYGQDISARWVLVSASICQNTDKKVMNDGFRSFPSGHSSFSFSGLLYLSLFLCSKLSIRLPYLPLQPSHYTLSRTESTASSSLPLHTHDITANTDNHIKPNDSSEDRASSATHLRNLAASPPVYLIIIAFAPIAVAIYICSTRYVEFYHHGIDIFTGSLIGIVSSWGAFRWYHLPLRRGEGWAWGPRSLERAWGIGVGADGWSRRGVGQRDGEVRPA